MKKIFFIIPSLFFLLATPVFASTTLSATPTWNENNSIVHVEFNTDNPTYAYLIYPKGAGYYVSSSGTNSKDIDFTSFQVPGGSFKIIVIDYSIPPFSCYGLIEECLASDVYVPGYDFDVNYASPAVSKTIIKIPTASSSDLFSSVSQLFSDFWILIALAIGTPLAFFTIEMTIDMINPGYLERKEARRIKDKL